MSLKIYSAFLFILFCSCVNSNKNRNDLNDCKRELLMAKQSLELNNLKVQGIESAISEIAYMDSLLSAKLKHQTSQLEQFKVNESKIESILDSLISSSEKIDCVDALKDYKPTLKELIELKEKCDLLFLQLDNFTFKDSIYRKKLKLDLLPYTVLFKQDSLVNRMEPSNYYSEFQIQVDTKVNILIKKINTIYKSYKEIVSNIRTD